MAEGVLRKGILRILLFWIVLGSLLYYLFDRPGIFESIMGVSLAWIAILPILGTFTLLLIGLVLKTLLFPFKIYPATLECFGISCLTAAGNCLTSVGGGTVGKAVYLKKKYDFPYPAFAASTLVAYILDILCASLLGIVVVIFSGNIWEDWGWKVLSVFMSTGLVASFLIAFRKNFTSHDRMFLKPLADISEGWDVIAKDKSLIANICLLVFVIHILAAVELFVGYTAISARIGISEVIIIVVVSSLSGIIRITPGNLGIQEAVVASSSFFLGIGFEKGLLAAGLVRVVAVSMIFLYSGIYSIGLSGLITAKAGDEGILTRGK